MERRTKFAGYCARGEECVSNLVNWTPKYGKKKPGRPALNYIDILKQDTGLHASDVITAMQDRIVWHAINIYCRSRIPLELSKQAHIELWIFAFLIISQSEYIFKCYLIYAHWVMTHVSTNPIQCFN